jgi:3-oxoacyl-[acyl-carrier protein] reductase
LTAHATCIADVANAVLFFANPKSNFITGQALYVDGGVFTQSNWPY